MGNVNNPPTKDSQTHIKEAAIHTNEHTIDTQTHTLDKHISAAFVEPSKKEIFKKRYTRQRYSDYDKCNSSSDYECLRAVTMTHQRHKVKSKRRKALLEKNDYEKIDVNQIKERSRFLKTQKLSPNVDDATLRTLPTSTNNHSQKNEEITSSVCDESIQVTSIHSLQRSKDLPKSPHKNNCVSHSTKTFNATASESASTSYYKIMPSQIISSPSTPIHKRNHANSNQQKNFSLPSSPTSSTNLPPKPSKLTSPERLATLYARSVSKSPSRFAGKSRLSGVPPLHHLSPSLFTKSNFINKNTLTKKVQSDEIHFANARTIVFESLPDHKSEYSSSKMLSQNRWNTCKSEDSVTDKSLLKSNRIEGKCIMKINTNPKKNTKSQNYFNNSSNKHDNKNNKADENRTDLRSTITKNNQITTKCSSSSINSITTPLTSTPTTIKKSCTPIINPTPSSNNITSILTPSTNITLKNNIKSEEEGKKTRKTTNLFGFKLTMKPVTSTECKQTEIKSESNQIKPNKSLQSRIKMAEKSFISKFSPRGYRKKDDALK